MEATELPFFPEMVETLHKIPNNISGIYLIGSAARGELSAYKTGQSLELFSDIELFVVTSKQIPASSRKVLFARLSEIERAVDNPNPLFHIDVLLRENYRLSQMRPTIFTFELKKNGKLLWGQDTSGRIPEITLSNLDYLDANEILYKRLWALLLHLPKRWLSGTLSPAEKRLAGYIFCRNALDISTVLLPQANILLPTYRQRVEKLAAIYPDLPFAKLFGEDFPAFMEMCLERRLDLDFQNVNMDALYSKTIHYLELALSCVSHQQQNYLQGFQRGYNERPVAPRQWLNLAHLEWRLVRQSGIRSAAQWLRLPKKEVLTQGLLAMHLALLAWKNNKEKEARSQLAHSKALLQQLSGKEFLGTGVEFSAEWQDARKAWGHFWGDFIRLGDPRYPIRYEEIMEWQHE